MVNPFICGSGSFQEDDDPLSISPSSTPKKSRKSGKDKNNPFSTRGLDKFNTLLADLEEKKQKIYSEMGTYDQDNSLVRFVYSSSANDVVPIVIRLKSKSGELVREKFKDHLAIDSRKAMDKLPIEAGQVLDEKEVKETKQEAHHQEKADKRRLNSIWNIKLKNWRRPSFYMPVALVLILLFLVFFGRPVAILCTSIGWYLVPTLSSKKQQPITKKKVYGRGYSVIKMVNNRSSPSPPKSNIANHNKTVKASKENWHRQTGHRRSF